jgi:DNA-binding MarR family transcriptional regulator
VTQILTGQDIGQAHHATRAVLQRLLAGTNTDFHQWVALNLLGSNESRLSETDLVARIVHGLKLSEAEARDVVAEIIDLGLVSRTEKAGRLALTTAGTARFDQVKAGIAQITERLYGGLPPEELAIAHRTLATVTARANAELGG